MAKIEKLTPAQEADMVAVREHWLAVGRNTQPINRQRAEDAIAAMYAAIGKDRPKFWMCQSPWQAAVSIALIKSLAGKEMPDNLRANLWANLGTNLRDNLWANLRDNLRANLRANLWANLGTNLWDNLWANLGTNLRDNLWANLRDNLRANLDYSYFSGQHWCAWEVFYDFCNRIGVPYAAKDRATLDLWLDQSRECHWWWPKEGLVVMTDRHTVLNLDDRGRLHSLSGPACAYSDGWAVYAVHGVSVPADIIETPESITPARIDAETNAEVRRIMIDRYGPKRYVTDSGATVVAELPADHPQIGLRTARLLRKEVPNDEPIIYLDLLNSTPEPDGSVKRYMQRIDPNAYGGEAARNVHAASASTWRDRNADGTVGPLTYKRWQDYVPSAES
jgi:hypothetical protein